MRVGATILSEHMDILRDVYTRVSVSPKYSLPLFDSDFRYPAKKQFEAALQHYKNDGTRYDFYQKRCWAPGCKMMR